MTQKQAESLVKAPNKYLALFCYEAAQFRNKRREERKKGERNRDRDILVIN